VFTQKLLNGFLSTIYNTSLKIKRSKMDSKYPKTLEKPYKYLLREKGKKDVKRKKTKKEECLD
jgi:hypothetical protein